MKGFNLFVSDLAGYVWWPILFLIIGGGVFFIFYSGFIQYKYFFHAINVLRGKYDDPNAPGQISSYKALSTALASTVGMGNLAGVAAAIALGGPGALFWMWVTSFIGMSTNFFTSTLASMYRGKDSEGQLQGGPMYIIREALSKRWQPLAVLFCVCCMIGALPIFQANQLTQALVDIGLKSNGIEETFVHIVPELSISIPKFVIGILICIVCTIVIIGGIKRIGAWAGSLVPLMIVLHFVSVVYILIIYADQVPYYLGLVFTDAFSPEHFRGSPFLGGVTGGIIMLGVRRATFSNEAGIGTAPMAMSAAKSTEPVREGLISMLSPVIDTIISCSLTALAILVTGVWKNEGISGITLTSQAYKSAMPYGEYILLVCTFIFAISALFSYSYYGRKALSFLVGVDRSKWYDYLYLAAIMLGALASMNFVLDVIDIAFALMAIPTMLSAFVLAPRVMAEAKRYFSKLNG